MFEPGEQVVCVNDDPVPVQYSGGVEAHNTPLVKGQVYTVRVFYPADTVHIVPCRGDTYEIRFLVPGIAIGVIGPMGWDCWQASRFRKIQRQDIAQRIGRLQGIDGLGPAKTLVPA